jgi:uncharacterized protein YjiK
VLLLILAGWGCPTIREHLGDSRDIDRSGLDEPSGIVYHTGRNTLFVIGDAGDLLEMKTDGTPVRSGRIERADCEGVTFDPATGRVYVAVEGQEAIWEVDPDTFTILRKFTIPRTFQGRTILKAGGQGIEGITFVPDAGHPQGGTFFVTNQAFSHDDPEDDSLLVEVEAPLRKPFDRLTAPSNVEGETGKKAEAVRQAHGPEQGRGARVLRAIPMETTDLSGMHYDAKRNLLVIISDTEDLLMEVSLDGKVLATRPLTGVNQEGITFDDEGNMYIAQDSGGVLKVK